MSPSSDARIEKPLGYAGDYQVMRLTTTEQLVGDSLYAKLLHRMTRHLALGQAVNYREATIREAVHHVASRPGSEPVRILALACGPALELQRALSASGTWRRPVEFILMDQDEEAVAVAYLERSSGISSRVP